MGPQFCIFLMVTTDLKECAEGETSGVFFVKPQVTKYIDMYIHLLILLINNSHLQYFEELHGSHFVKCTLLTILVLYVP